MKHAQQPDRIVFSSVGLTAQQMLQMYSILSCDASFGSFCSLLTSSVLLVLLCCVVIVVVVVGSGGGGGDDDEVVVLFWGLFDCSVAFIFFSLFYVYFTLNGIHESDSYRK